MKSATQPGLPLPKYCSVATTLKAPGQDCAVSPQDLSFSCPFALRAPWLLRHHALSRCASYHPCLHLADPAWQGQGRVGDALGTWVLARREQDGFYYRAQIKATPELERQGALVVEFEAPIVAGPKLPVRQQSVVSGEDIIQVSPSMEYSLQPGDKVLAPWELDQHRYGPGTVLLGLETRDLHRASKEEEVIVQFWNGKIAKVPLGGVRWVPPTVWRKAVERLHTPCTREHPSPLLWLPCCSLSGPVTGHIADGSPLDTRFLSPPCHPHTCCQLLCQGGLCCCLLRAPTWWPLTRTSEVRARELPESELKATAELLPLEGPEEEAAAASAPMAVSSPSSSSSSSEEEEDLEKDLEVGLPQKLMMHRAVNTDPILPEKLPRQRGPHQPEWRYWRRNGPEPSPGKPGRRLCNIWKKENKQDKVQIAVVGTTQELTLKATNVKPWQALPKDTEYRKLNLDTVTHQGDKNCP